MPALNALPSAHAQPRIVDNITTGAQAAALVAQGRLDLEIDSQQQDETGDLLRALGCMVRQLRHSIQTVLAVTDSIGTASAEIATGNQDLSVRTEETASNLQPAASSIEHITGTVRQSADAARQANPLAISAAEVAQRGRHVVARVVATMDDINHSSRKIADIIGVIDGIAFQTHILALNAALVEQSAAESLKEQAFKLGQVVGRFELDGPAKTQRPGSGQPGGRNAGVRMAWVLGCFTSAPQVSARWRLSALLPKVAACPSQSVNPNSAFMPPTSIACVS